MTELYHIGELKYKIPFILNLHIENIHAAESEVVVEPAFTSIEGSI
jgi:hypothetical protein